MSDQEWPSAPGGDQGNDRPQQPPSEPPPAAPSSAGAPPPSASPPPSSPPPIGGGYGQPAATATMPGLGMRLLGRIIDAFVVGIPMVILFAMIPGLTVGGLVYSLITALVGFGYFVYMESSTGATVGKKLLNMKVVGSDGQPLSMEASAMRNWWLLIGVLSGIPVIGFLASLASLGVVVYIAVTISGDPNNRGWHDQLADAGVVPA